ncbi:MAG: glycosyltransferase [Pyrinomonadaceae bacterium]
MSNSNPKILIISSDTGGGHRSAAQALSEGIARFWNGESAAVRILKAVEESHHLTRRMVAIYNWILRHRQDWMKYLYWFINRFQPERSKFFLDKCVVFCRDQFEKWFPHIIVSVHPMTQHVFARILRELNLTDTIPLVTVVTDPCYGFWKGWACDEVSLYLVANEDAKQQLVDYGIDPEKIKISGMPVNPKFSPVDENDARAARRAFGLDEEKFTVFVNAGYVGGGNVPGIFRELTKGELDVQAIFLAGKNEELKREAEEIARTAKFPVRVIGYSDEVEKIMQGANVMISKLGGLTTFEAFSCHLPIIADVTTPPMPQEKGTAALISKRGAGVLLDRVVDIVPTVRSLSTDQVRYQALKQATRDMAVNGSTQRIISEITALLPAKENAA